MASSCFSISFEGSRYQAAPVYFVHGSWCLVNEKVLYNAVSSTASKMELFPSSPSSAQGLQIARHQADKGLLSKAAFNASVFGCTFIRASDWRLS
jgi:hypothetical protein